MPVLTLQGVPRTNLLGRNRISFMASHLSNNRSRKKALDWKNQPHKRASVFRSEFQLKSVCRLRAFKLWLVPEEVAPKVEDILDRLTPRCNDRSAGSLPF